MSTIEDRHYAMGVLAAKKAMSDGNAFSAMCNQAEEVLAKETPEEKVARLRIHVAALLNQLDMLPVKHPQQTAEREAARAALR